ncbi:MAG: M3 family metallopeptidase [Calditrichia bacterium]
MGRKMILAVLALMMVLGCSRQETNPFFEEWTTPFGTPPFQKIKNEHYLPAFQEAFKQHNAEIEAIVNNPEEPTFENTIVALEKSGSLLRKVNGVFDNLLSANTNDELQAIAKQVTPMKSKHWDEIYLNEKLFQRIKAVYEKKDDLPLDKESLRVLEKYYKEFVRGGANLPADKKEEFKKINEELSMLSLQFGENILKEVKRFELVIEDEKDLAGLPEGVIAAAAETAKQRGHEGKWVFTIDKPSLIPFLQYAENRALREKIFQAYIMQGDHDDELDNKKILSRIAMLRVKRAHLLGYKNHAEYVIEENMAKTPENVYKLLNQLWKPALEKAKQERAELQKMIEKEGGNFKLQAWDWWYYAEKLKKEKYNLSEEELRPYFAMENVRKGVFMVANKLFGLQFEKRTDIPVYHPDVEAFEVKNADGSHVGILYTDYYPRAGKRGGAWMNAYRKQSNMDGNWVSPVICNVGNFSKPTADTPALLSLDEALTMFHEFGHALHGLLSRCTYPKVSGTNVAWDFVELPSQIMENWATEPEVLKMYAKHYKTGEPIPDELIEKIKKAGTFNQGFATVEYLAAAFLDLDWHTLTQPKEWDARLFEGASIRKMGLIPEIVVRYRSPYFRHIFSGGYSAGYYVYVWAEVLDADAFNAFKESGDIFNPKYAKAFRENILEKGGSEDPMELYVRFRGQEPSIEPLLKRRGLK